jgi:hypothetical protein
LTNESKNFLDQNRHYYDHFIRTETFLGFDMTIRQGLLDVVKKEFNPTYMADLWCPPCVIDLLKYTYTQYDKYLKQN